MQITLNDEEIRLALAEAISKKLDHQFEVNPDNCWFEAMAGIIDNTSVDPIEVLDIHNVRFSFDTDNN